MLKTFLPPIQFVNDFLTIRKRPFYSTPCKAWWSWNEEQNHHFTICVNMEFINLVVFKYVCI